MTKRLVHAIDIDAGPQRVWEVLTELAAYPRWNPVLLQADGHVEVGSTLIVLMQSGSRRARAPRSYGRAPRPSKPPTSAPGSSRSRKVSHVTVDSCPASCTIQPRRAVALVSPRKAPTTTCLLRLMRWPCLAKREAGRAEIAMPETPDVS
jgi:polyketide cyclase/dehydrase/lipid transport protein